MIIADMSFRYVPTNGQDYEALLERLKDTSIYFFAWMHTRLEMRGVMYGCPKLKPGLYYIVCIGKSVVSVFWNERSQHDLLDPWKMRDKMKECMLALKMEQRGMLNSVHAFLFRAPQHDAEMKERCGLYGGHIAYYNGDLGNVSPMDCEQYHKMMAELARICNYQMIDKPKSIGPMAIHGDLLKEESRLLIVSIKEPLCYFTEYWNSSSLGEQDTYEYMSGFLQIEASLHGQGYQHINGFIFASKQWKEVRNIVDKYRQ